MTKLFDGKVALITGAGRGIGAATAKLLAAQGAKVVLTSRTKRELDEVAQQINAQYGEKTALAHCADVSDETAVKHLFVQAKAAYGRVDILINNAGAIVVEDFINFDAHAWDQVMNINVRGSFLCAREFFREIKNSGRTMGCIVNLSSLGGIRGTEKFKGMSAYVVAKHAVVGLTESLAVEGRPLGIRVNCVAPGAVDTLMLKQAAPFLKTKTTADDVARTILFLCDDAQAAALNGAIVEIHSNL